MQSKVTVLICVFTVCPPLAGGPHELKVTLLCSPLSPQQGEVSQHAAVLGWVVRESDLCGPGGVGGAEMHSAGVNSMLSVLTGDA